MLETIKKVTIRVYHCTALHIQEKLGEKACATRSFTSLFSFLLLLLQTQNRKWRNAVFIKDKDVQKGEVIFRRSIMQEENWRV